jgi:peptidoglycan/xylan/chitin deacetylase (PgdA/CDA1 family)
LAEFLQVRFPDRPVEDYGPISVTQAREMVAHGISIGNHTRSHPILSRLDQNQLQDEILGSKEKLERLLDVSVKLFCYPNGRRRDINSDVVRHVIGAGHKCAVVAYADSEECGADVFRIGRMDPGDHDLVDFLWKLYGGETIMARIGFLISRLKTNPYKFLKNCRQTPAKRPRSNNTTIVR